MTNDNSNTGGLGQMLRKAATEKTPPGLDIVIMQKIRAAELRRTYRRMVSAFILRFCSVVFLLAVGGKIFLAHTSDKNIAGLLNDIPDIISSTESWVSGYTYLTIPFLIITFLTWCIGRSLTRAL